MPANASLHLAVPSAVAARGDTAARVYRAFIAGPSANTRDAYARALDRFFTWSEDQGLRDVAQLESRHVAAWVAAHPGSPATVRQHLAAVRTLFDAFVASGVLPYSPAAAVRGPCLDAPAGRTPVLTSAEVVALIDQLPLHEDSGLRDRALIVVLLLAFARISEALAMNVEDYVLNGEHAAFRFCGRGGRVRIVPAHPLAEAFVEPYLARLHERSGTTPGTPLFCTVDRRKCLTTNRLTRNDALYMLRRRARAARLRTAVTPSTLRATGLARFRANGGGLEAAQCITGGADSRRIQRYRTAQTRPTRADIARIRL